MVDPNFELRRGPAFNLLDYISLLFACSDLSHVNRIVTGNNPTTNSNLADMSSGSLEGEES